MAESVEFDRQRRSLKIFVNAIDAAGHMNSVVGMAQALRSRGHRIYFLINETFAPEYVKFGFEQIVLRRTTTPNEKEKSKKDDKEEEEEATNPFKSMIDLVQSMGLLANTDSFQKLKALRNEAWIEESLEIGMDFHPQIVDAIDRERPDVILLDQVVIPPAVLQSNIPWVLLISANPLMFYGSDRLPPAFSGYATGDENRALWTKFRQQLKISFNMIGDFQEKLNRACGYEPSEDQIEEQRMMLRERESDIEMYASPYLNIYGYPRELDYRGRELAEKIGESNRYISVDAFCREMPNDETNSKFEIPAQLNVQPGDKLIYVSMGSMGGMDVEMMKRITATISKMRDGYRFIVSKGPRHDEYDLPSDNCWGAAYLPQTSILPLVDCVVTHGGNNTITETFAAGKPMIVMPLFIDQFDNAQRVHELRYGIRMNPYSFTEQELIDAIKRLVTDQELKDRLDVARSRIAKSNMRKADACERIEAMVREEAAKSKSRLNGK